MRRYLLSYQKPGINAGKIGGEGMRKRMTIEIIEEMDAEEIKMYYALTDETRTELSSEIESEMEQHVREETGRSASISVKLFTED
jgi:hypothetical protein